jgi:hypothetical protein
MRNAMEEESTAGVTNTESTCLGKVSTRCSCADSQTVGAINKTINKITPFRKGVELIMW